MDDLMETNPGQAYCILKKMGAQPGDCYDSNTFTLPSHESVNLPNQQSAEHIAQHFATISQEYSPLNISGLPVCVQAQLEKDIIPPLVSEYETYTKILSAKKPKSGVPGYMPKTIVQEFAPELSTPVCLIINNIVTSGEWPSKWTMEYVTPIGKIPLPESEDDLRPISLKGGSREKKYFTRK